MPISSIQTIETPWTPYAMTFARDGSRLAIAGGSWDGHGGIMLLDIDHQRTGWLNWMDLPCGGPPAGYIQRG